MSCIKHIYTGEESWRVFPKVYDVYKVQIYGAKYVLKMFKKNGNWETDKDFLFALQTFYQNVQLLPLNNLGSV